MLFAFDLSDFNHDRKYTTFYPFFLDHFLEKDIYDLNTDCHIDLWILSAQSPAIVIIVLTVHVSKIQMTRFSNSRFNEA